MSIPMPGHPIPAASLAQTQADVAALEKLFDEHDAVFLLMDSRESRWLPTVLGAAKGKVSIFLAFEFGSLSAFTRFAGRSYPTLIAPPSP
jgi:ubiquitin-like modifier-activating enzyme ATG7